VWVSAKTSQRKKHTQGKSWASYKKTDLGRSLPRVRIGPKSDGEKKKNADDPGRNTLSKKQLEKKRGTGGEKKGGPERNDDRSKRIGEKPKGPAQGAGKCQSSAKSWEKTDHNRIRLPWAAGYSNNLKGKKDFETKGRVTKGRRTTDGGKGTP